MAKTDLEIFDELVESGKLDELPPDEAARIILKAMTCRNEKKEKIEIPSHIWVEGLSNVFH